MNTAIYLALVVVVWDTVLLLRIRKNLYNIAREEVAKAANEVAGEFEQQLTRIVLAPLRKIAERFGIRLEDDDPTATKT